MRTIVRARRHQCARENATTLRRLRDAAADDCVGVTKALRGLPLAGALRPRNRRARWPDRDLVSVRALSDALPSRAWRRVASSPDVGTAWRTARSPMRFSKPNAGGPARALPDISSGASLRPEDLYRAALHPPPAVHAMDERSRAADLSGTHQSEWHLAERGPDRGARGPTGQARRLRIPGVFEGGATTPGPPARWSLIREDKPLVDP